MDNRKGYNHEPEELTSTNLSKMSDSEEELIAPKQKSCMLLDSDDDESNNDEKFRRTNGLVECSDVSQDNTKSLSPRNENDNKHSADNTTKVASRDSPRKSTKSDSSDDESQSRSRKSSTSSRRSRSGSRKSSSSSDRSKPRSRKSSSSRSRSGSRSRSSSTSSNRSKPRSRKSSSSRSRSRSRSRSSSASSNESNSQPKKSDNSDDEKQSACVKRSNKSDDSDGEKFTSSKSTLQKGASAEQKSNAKFSLITESDLESEDDGARPLVNESSSEEDLSSTLNKKAKKLHKKKSPTIKKTSHSKSVGSSLLTDSSGSDNEEKSSLKSVPKSGTKRKSETKPERKPKASKKEKDPMLSIRSETQRMIREGRISLPYHQPKQRSLHEFLERRKAAPSIPLKVTSAELKTVCEQLTMKEKEVENFYKSESDHSDGETNTNIENDTTKDAEATLTDSVINNKVKSNELEHDKDTNSITVDSQNIDETPSLVLELGQATNAAQFEKIGAEPGENDENLPTKESAGTPIIEKNTFEEIIANGSNRRCTAENDQTTLRDVDDAKNLSKNCQTISNVLKTNEDVNESVIPDSVDFELRIEDSCPDNTDDLTKSSNKSDSEVIADSVDFELKLTDSPSKDIEIPAPSAEPKANSGENSVDTERKSKPVISKDRLKNRIEALLSSRNIKLSSINFDSAPESLQFEIPSYEKFSDEKPGGIHELKKKFIKHSMAKNKSKSAPSQVNVVTTQTDAEGDITGITKETLTLGSQDDENEFSNFKLKAPGAKHAYLKKKMLDMLIMKKEATWNEYQNEKRKCNGFDSEEENDIEENDDEDVSCKKLDFEPYHPEDEPDDDELIEDDILYEEKIRDKNAFVEEEAEVSDLESEEDDNVPDDNDDDNSVDSDGLDFAKKDDSPSKPAQSEHGKNIEKLFKYDTTGTELENKLLGFESVSHSSTSEDVSASQIFGLCSGKFATQVPSSNDKPCGDDAEEDEFFVDSSLNMEDSQNICLTLPDTDNTVENSTEVSNKRASPEPNDGLDNEDEEDEEEIIVRRKPIMRIVEDSDDETTEPTNEANDNNELSDQDDNAEDEEDEEEELAEGEGDDIEAEEYGYNSEEELVTYDKAAARDFFENEAELSESEWGSEDENEKDLDKLEKEAGDDDDIDADKLKEELGKIHMRQLLDDDQHDVNILKEMLLEDGDLHSDEKRQRKFQWKNLTDGDDFFKKYTNDSDDENTLNEDDNDDSEEHWRKLRHEREVFLSQQEKKSILPETSTECLERTFMKLPTSTKVVTESISAKIMQRVSNISKDKPDADLPSNKPQFNCGSFLSRGKVLLSKMALSVSSTNGATTSGNIKGVKNSRNFVFGARSPEKQKVTVTVEKTEKRKSTNLSTSVSKKIRLSVQNSTTKPAQKGLLSQLALLD